MNAGSLPEMSSETRRWRSSYCEAAATEATDAWEDTWEATEELTLETESMIGDCLARVETLRVARREKRSMVDG